MVFTIGMQSFQFSFSFLLAFQLYITGNDSYEEGSGSCSIICVILRECMQSNESHSTVTSSMIWESGHASQQSQEHTLPFVASHGFNGPVPNVYFNHKTCAQEGSNSLLVQPTVVTPDPPFLHASSHCSDPGQPSRGEGGRGLLVFELSYTLIILHTSYTDLSPVPLYRESYIQDRFPFR